MSGEFGLAFFGWSFDMKATFIKSALFSFLMKTIRFVCLSNDNTEIIVNIIFDPIESVLLPESNLAQWQEIQCEHEVCQMPT